MKLIRTVQTIREQIKRIRDKKIGFVPTMGYLHDGHLSLVEQAKKENDLVVMSIFVNPLQFGPNEDFERYPRNEQKDAKVAKEKGVDILFMPSVEEMYPEDMSIQMTITNGTDVLCGSSRPGHFDGVATVLTKLFHLIQPTNAYFGLKDAQQFAIVNTLVSEMNFPLSLIGLPTVRETDGLAKSSRNVYLTDDERKEAVALYASLQHAQKLIVDGLNNPATIIMEVKKVIKNRTKARIDYVDILSYPNLQKINVMNGQVIIAIAVQFTHARLIDNIILSANGERVDRLVQGG